jgi:processive 1,2-diacylglycerol beta-glucosyltransferase
MKILIIHASFGAGHKRAAQAIMEAFQKKGVKCEIRDLLEFLPKRMAKFYSSAYVFMITKSRGLWRLTYRLVNAPRSPYSPAKGISQRWQFKKLKSFLKEGDFTHVISTHFTPSALLTDWKSSGELNCKIFSVITDHEAHRCWKRKGLDHYFVATDTVAKQMRDYGVPSEIITISGIPISEAFSNTDSRELARSEWNLSLQDKVALVLCSALTLKKSLQILSEFAQMKESIQFLVSTGHDSEKEGVLKDKFTNDKRFTIFGFSNRIAEMMRAADVVVTKPGGLIVSEALAMGLPQILLEPIPGQEEANARFAENQGAAICIRHKRGIFIKTLSDLIRDERKLEKMRVAAQNTGRPKAAEEVVNTILKHDAL